ncbi:hypothetical protein MBLNU230_g8609t1 [Neophaeotheca triangularis]
MSTLTSSPSPAASPRNPFPASTATSRSPYISSSRSSPRRLSTAATNSPRPAPQYSNSSNNKFKAPPLNAPIPVAVPAAQEPKNHPLGREPTGAGGRNTVDVGTQYSPEGFPPTAGAKLTSHAAAVGQPTAPTKKRKDVSSSAQDSDIQMSGAIPADNRAQHATPSSSAQVPEEPDPRTDPDRTTSTTQPTSHGSASPQEARTTISATTTPKRPRPSPTSTPPTLMPTDYSTSSANTLGTLIASMLLELIRLNDKIPLRDGRLTRFHSRAPPAISVADYLQRLIKHATLSPPILLSIVYYIDRLCALYPAFTINSLTVHRFLITAATVAAKGLSDSFWTNPTYARIGGIPVAELATLELEFLQRVEWKIVPKPELLEDYYVSLVERSEGFKLEGDGDAASEGSAGSSAGGDSEGVVSGRIDGNVGGSAGGVADRDRVMEDAPG